MSNSKENLNKFLTEVFHDVLRLEEAALSKGEFKNLSIHEMHVIEAVYDGNQEGLHTMAEIAGKLMITASTLTTAVKTLEHKGYLQRNKLNEDKRRVSVSLTEAGLIAYNKHREFHNKLVENVEENLSNEELLALENALSTLHNFFHSLK